MSSSVLEPFFHTYREGNVSTLEQFFDFSREKLTEDSKYLMRGYEKSLTQFNFIKDVIEDSTIHEIILHGPREIQTFGKATNRFSSDLSLDEFNYIAESLCLQEGKRWNTSRPFHSFLYQTTTGHRFRVSIAHRCIIASSDSHKIFLRRILDRPFELSQFLEPASYDENTFLEDIRLKRNILIAGSTGSGKTSFLRSLLNHVSEKEHVVTIEDTHEIVNTPENWTQLISTPENNIELNQHCAFALRMRPDRIIIGELRSYEVTTFQLMLNTGHRGCISTIHADSAQDALHRITHLYQMHSQAPEESSIGAMEIFCRNIDKVVFLKDKSVSSVISVIGQSKGKPVFEHL